MPVPRTYSTDAIVLSRFDLGEADRVLTLITPGLGKLKAIAVRGTGSVRIAADRQEWKKLHYYVISGMGANNQHVVPNSPQPWAEFVARYEQHFGKLSL